MEEKKFVKVNGKEYAEKGIASGQFSPVVAVKFTRIAARPGVVGEQVITYTQNGEVEKVATVQEGQYVVTKLSETGEVVVDEFGHTNDWVMDAAVLAKKYELDPTKEGVYQPKGVQQVFVPIVMDVILEQWGGEMRIEAGGWLNITDEGDIYGISERDFNDTYRLAADIDYKKVLKR